MPPVYAKAGATRKVSAKSRSANKKKGRWPSRRPGREEVGESPEARPREDRRKDAAKPLASTPPPRGPAGSAPRIDGIPPPHRRAAQPARLLPTPRRARKDRADARAARWSPRAATASRGGSSWWRRTRRPARRSRGPRRGEAWAKRAPVLIAAGARREDAAVVESRTTFFSTRDWRSCPSSIARRPGLLAHRWRGGRRSRCGPPSGFRGSSPRRPSSRRLRGKQRGPRRGDAEEGREARRASPSGRSPSVRGGGSRSRDAAFRAREGVRDELQLRFGDTDAMGHVNNAKLVTYLELGRVRFFADVMVWSGSRTTGSSSQRSPAATGSPSC